MKKIYNAIYFCKNAQKSAYYFYNKFNAMFIETIKKNMTHLSIEKVVQKSPQAFDIYLTFNKVASSEIAILNVRFHDEIFKNFYKIDEFDFMNRTIESILEELNACIKNEISEEYLSSCLSHTKNSVDKCLDEYNIPQKMMKIKSILVNEKKRVTTVVFDNGDIQIATCSPEDEFDVSVGVAICISGYLAGSKRNFKEFVNKTAKFVKEKKSVKKTHTKVKDK